MTETVTLPAVPSQYSKALVWIGTAALAGLVPLLADDVLTLAEVISLAILVVNAIAVYLVPVAHYLKGVAAFVGAGLSALPPIIEAGGFTSLGDVPLTAWITVLLASLGAVGVVITPNTPTTVEALPPEPLFPELADDGEYVDPDEYDRQMAASGTLGDDDEPGRHVASNPED